MEAEVHQSLFEMGQPDHLPLLTTQSQRKTMKGFNFNIKHYRA